MAEKKPAVSDEAVRKATGKDWKQWFALLDKQGAEKLAHRDIARLLQAKYVDSGWWSQMITVCYERARGLREIHQTADGFVANVSKTFNASLDQLYKAWHDAAERADWLAAQGIEITRSTANKSIRMIWNDGVSRVAVNFYPKGKDKTQVTIDHSRLESAKDVAKTKSTWKQSLEELQKKLQQYG
jgi:uncharacterized protein YndB with AHSA1/START domain